MTKETFVMFADPAVARNKRIHETIIIGFGRVVNVMRGGQVLPMIVIGVLIKFTEGRIRSQSFYN